MTRNLLVTALVALLMTGFVLVARALTGAVAPPVKAYLDGKEVLFVHTEASDPQVADRLTKMKDSPVLVVPGLARAPAEMVATAYVFTNGVKGGGPFKFQADVFDNPPGTPAYSPLRRVVLVAWNDERSARLLKSADEVSAAIARGEVAATDTGVVVNMPLLTWPGGKR